MDELRQYRCVGEKVGQVVELLERDLERAYPAAVWPLVARDLVALALQFSGVSVETSPPAIGVIADDHGVDEQPFPTPGEEDIVSTTRLYWHALRPWDKACQTPRNFSLQDVWVRAVDGVECWCRLLRHAPEVQQDPLHGKPIGCQAVLLLTPLGFLHVALVPELQGLPKLAVLGYCVRYPLRLDQPVQPCRTLLG